MTDPNGPSPRRAVRRGAARLAAVQALYQLDLTEAVTDRVLEEFIRYRMHGASQSSADRSLFIEIVRGAMAHRTVIDEMISSALAEGWSMERMDRVLRAILRAGALELYSKHEIPPRVAITEYVDIAHAFFEGKEPGFVNGVMDRLARVLRPDEMVDRAKLKGA